MAGTNEKHHITEGQKKLMLAGLALGALILAGLALEVLRAYIVA